MIMNSQSSEVSMHIVGNGKLKYSDTAQIVGDSNIARLFYDSHDATEHFEASLEPYLNVCLNDICRAPESECPPTRHVTRGEQRHTPDTSCTSPSSSLDVNLSVVDDDSAPFVFADRASGVVFSSGLIRASGDRVTAEEFRKEARALVPTLHLVIPSLPTAKQQQAPEDSDEKGSTSYPSASLPTFALTLASPITSPHSPIHPPIPSEKPFTHASYYAQVARARAPFRSTRRIPYLPQYCAHTLRPFIPPTNCPLCAIQLLACETWYNSRNTHTRTHIHAHTDTHAFLPPSSKNRGGESRSRMMMTTTTMLRAPQVLPADCTPTTRAIFYALGLPLGKLDGSCVDWDVVDAIMFIPSCPPPYRGGKKKTAVVRRSSSSSSRIHVLFRRARHFFGTPARVLMTRTPTFVYHLR